MAAARTSTGELMVLALSRAVALEMVGEFEEAAVIRREAGQSSEVVASTQAHNAAKAAWKARR